MDFTLLPTDALLVVDVQYDFLEGGALGVPDSNAILPVVKTAVALFHDRLLPVIASRDWHPRNHCSFVNNGGPWPEHCVAGTRGGELSEEIDFPDTFHLISKATDPDQESYSAFDNTGLAEYLRAHSVTRLFVCGLALDYCVLYTVRDALQHGFEVVVLEDGVRAVDVQPGDGMRAAEEMKEKGAMFTVVEEIR